MESRFALRTLACLIIEQDIIGLANVAHIWAFFITKTAPRVSASRIDASIVISQPKARIASIACLKTTLRALETFIDFTDSVLTLADLYVEFVARL